MGNGESVEAVSDELLTNANDIKSWNFGNSERDWLSTDDDTFDICFASYDHECKKSQLIDLISLGYRPEILDAQPQVHVVDYFRGHGSEGGRYKLRVKLLDCHHQQLGSALFEYSATTIPMWQLVSYTFTQYNSGLRFIIFEQSFYGSKVADSSVSFEFAAVTNSWLTWTPPFSSLPVANAHPSGVTKYPDEKHKKAVSRIISYWNHDQIYNSMKEGMIVKGDKTFKQDAKNYFNFSEVHSTRIDLQWRRGGRAGIAVQISDVTYAQVNLPVNISFGARAIRRLLVRSLEAGKLVEVIKGQYSPNSKVSRGSVQYVAMVDGNITMFYTSQKTSAHDEL